VALTEANLVRSETEKDPGSLRFGRDDGGSRVAASEVARNRGELLASYIESDSRLSLLFDKEQEVRARRINQYPESE
jgi:hypothetical protein